MKLNNKGFALTSIVYMLIVLFLMLLLLILSNLATRKVVLDKLKYDVKNKLGQGGIVASAPDLPYLNTTIGVYYESLEDAFNNAQDNTENTIIVLKDVEDASTPKLVEDKIVTLDLNGYKVTMNKTITNNGNLTVSGTGELTSSTVSNITNTVTGTFTKEGTSTISNTGSSYHIINNQGAAIFSEGNVIAGYRAINNQSNGRLVISGADISAINMGIYNSGRSIGTETPSVKITDGSVISTSGHGIQNASTGMVYMSGGIVTSNGASAYGIQNSSGGNVTITGGTINAAYRCIRNASSSTLTIEGGTFSAVGVSGNPWSALALSLAGGTINVSGGTFNSDKGSSSSSFIIELENNTTPNVTITGGTFTSDGGGIAANGAGTLEFGGTAGITAVNNGISNNRTGTVTITGGTITSTSNAAVRNNSTGTVTITGGAMRSTNHDTINMSAGIINMSAGTVISDSNAGFGVSGGTLNISDGSISGKTFGVALSQAAATVNVTGGTIVASGGEGIGTYGTLTLGIDETTTSGITSVNTTTPSITGSTYGVRVYSGGTLNFYDGVVVGKKGNGSAISGTANTPSSYNVQRDLSGTTETAYLKGDYVVKVDPNGGAYNDSTSISSYAANSGTIMSLGNPIRSGYTFRGWLPTKEAYDATWVEVFYHNNRTGTVLFSNAEDWKDAKSTDGVDKYSILGQLEKFRTNTSQVFEFLLEYDEISGKYNRWQQTANPVTTTVADGDGTAFAPGYTTNFTGSHIDWTGNYWGGLTRSTSGQTFINGSVGHGNWFYAVGSRAIWGGNNKGIPGPNSTNINGAMHLWVKANNDLSNITQQVTGVVLNDTYTVKHDITLKAIWIPN